MLGRTRKNSSSYPRPGTTLLFVPTPNTHTYASKRTPRQSFTPHIKSYREQDTFISALKRSTFLHESDALPLILDCVVPKANLHMHERYRGPDVPHPPGVRNPQPHAESGEMKRKAVWRPTSISSPAHEGKTLIVEAECPDTLLRV